MNTYTTTTKETGGFILFYFYFFLITSERLRVSFFSSLVCLIPFTITIKCEGKDLDVVSCISI